MEVVYAKYKERRCTYVKGVYMEARHMLSWLIKIDFRIFANVLHARKGLMAKDIFHNVKWQLHLDAN